MTHDTTFFKTSPSTVKLAHIHSSRLDAIGYPHKVSETRTKQQSQRPLRALIIINTQHACSLLPHPLRPDSHQTLCDDQSHGYSETAHATHTSGPVVVRPIAKPLRQLQVQATEHLLSSKDQYFSARFILHILIEILQAVELCPIRFACI